MSETYQTRRQLLAKIKEVEEEEVKTLLHNAHLMTGNQQLFKDNKQFIELNKKLVERIKELEKEKDNGHQCLLDTMVKEENKKLAVKIKELEAEKSGNLWTEQEQDYDIKICQLEEQVKIQAGYIGDLEDKIKKLEEKNDQV